jgi:anti-sigma factor RsiW
MQQCGEADRASLYSLGLLDRDESTAFELHVSTCSECAAELRESVEIAVELSKALPVSNPPANLRQRVLNEAVLPAAYSRWFAESRFLGRRHCSKVFLRPGCMKIPSAAN